MSTTPATAATLTSGGHFAVKILRLVLATALVGVLTILALQPGARKHLGEAISVLSVVDIGLVALLFIMMRATQAMFLLRLLELHDQKISFGSSMTLAGLKGLFNLAFLGLGFVAQSAQAKLALLVPVRVMLLANVTQSFVLVLALGTSLFVTTLFFFSRTNLPAPEALIVGGLAVSIIGLVGAGTCLFPGRLPSWVRELRVSRWLLQKESSPKPGGAAALGVLILGLVLVALRLARVLAIAYAIDPEVELYSLMITVLAADTVSVVPITPGGIGVRELIIGFWGTVVDHYELFLAAAIVDRVLTIAFNLVHGTVAVWLSGRG